MNAYLRHREKEGLSPSSLAKCEKALRCFLVLPLNGKPFGEISVASVSQDDIDQALRQLRFWSEAGHTRAISTYYIRSVKAWLHWRRNRAGWGNTA